MKILKRNQLIILVISLMLVTAGYLNFTSTNDQNKDRIAELRRCNISYCRGRRTEVRVRMTEVGGQSSDDGVQKSDSENEIQNIEEDTEVVETIKEDTYFTSSKLDRENIYSQTLETYQEIYNNTNSTLEQKNNAIQEIAKINKQRNAIMIAENLCLAKGLEDIVIFANGSSVSVIVKAEELQESKIAQIQNIVSRELEVGAENINISTK